MSPRPHSARDVALDALLDRAQNVSARLDRLLAQGGLAHGDARLARELAMGVVRRQLTLQAVLNAFLARPGQHMPGPVEQIILLGLYQVIFLDRVPDFAAVNEAVEQASRHGHRRQSGLVNGLLRNVVRALSPPLEGPGLAGRSVIPLEPGRHRTMDRPIFDDPAQRPIEHYSRAFSIPLALAGRWREAHGAALAEELAYHANARPPLILRVNTAKTTVEEAIASLAAEGAEALPHANGLSVVLTQAPDLTALGVFREGLVQVQDPTATGVGAAAGAKAGMRVLDFCAAPGTKTTHLAELMGNAGHITAVDVSEQKLALVRSNCQRLGISIVETVLAERIGSLETASYDLALVDAPCSNTGVLSRRAEARWRFDAGNLDALRRDQIALVRAAAAFVRPGGRVVYSTCSIEPEECGQVASAAGRSKRLDLADQELALPGGADRPEQWHDGGFRATFRVRG
jgi:16S rRNA (cytosine967-C5)-methyltransferase